MKNIRVFYPKNFHFFFFLVLKCLIYLNRLVFVMDDVFTFSQKIDFGISCKFSPSETICMKFQSLLSGQ